MVIRVVEAQEVDQQRIAIPGWEQQYTQMSAGRFSGRILHAEVEGIELYEEQMNLRVEQEFHAPPGALVFSFDMSENTLYLLDGETRNAWVTPENYREVAVVIKQAGQWGQSLDGFADLVLTPLRSDNCRSVAASLSNMLTGASGGHHPMDAPGVAQTIVSDCFSLLCEAPLGDVHRSRSMVQAKRVVQRVKEVVNDCPEEHFGMTELAAKAGVSPRSLQQSFLRYAGLPPIVWLRNRRLNAARRDLLGAAESGTTVAEVAMKWSFWHLGRFSQSYHALFGEYPKTTVKQGGRT
ncbi:helix-turn-helix domain-containing protein [Metapseudomonas lalkuanensis]|uniref:Helix-turn-helix domain-containing protein n=2 Tax=Metapseudomonas lalkuanensis TaxID=2604832 RepID=A0A5J6QJ98_9GAMM|nr:helix-turn-helix domain-containing protein [Pseudomonas lalkuanensis]QEY62584.1 helix-turn-helix domain-containing protein [Pseudomonas lalkuanensis]UCO96192.1 helix-turn-helix domain-containing protein [Pseudomonas lalkuanensis]